MWLSLAGIAVCNLHWTGGLVISLDGIAVCDLHLTGGLVLFLAGIVVCVHDVSRAILSVFHDCRAAGSVKCFAMCCDNAGIDIGKYYMARHA